MLGLGIALELGVALGSSILLVLVMGREPEQSEVLIVRIPGDALKNGPVALHFSM